MEDGGIPQKNRMEDWHQNWQIWIGKKHQNAENMGVTLIIILIFSIFNIKNISRFGWEKQHQNGEHMGGHTDYYINILKF